MKKIATLPTLLSALLLASPAQAASTTSTITVTANVQSSCVLTGGSASSGNTTADFGTYNATTGNTAATTGGSVVSVNCALGTLYTATLGPGLHDTSGQRRLQNTTTSTSYLNYSLGLLDANSVLNSTIGVALPYVGLGTPVPLVIQGTLTGGQNPLIGNYQDEVTLTIAY